MRTYKTYRFINKDPIIDVLRTAWQDSGMTLHELAEKSGVSVATLYAWFFGDTQRPYNATLLAVAVAIGPAATRRVAAFIHRLEDDHKVIPFKQRA